MTDDLAAAVERLRMLRDGETVPWYHDGGSFAQWKVYYDRETVAEAYLARESDDAKPVDREWLVSVLGMEPVAISGSALWLKRPSHCSTRITLTLDGFVGYLRGTQGDHGVVLDTRGDVRAFLRLARWPANETTPGGGDAEK